MPAVFSTVPRRRCRNQSVIRGRTSCCNGRTTLSQIPHRATQGLAGQQCAGRPARRCRRGDQGDQRRRSEGRTRRQSGHAGYGQRAGRDAEAARRADQRNYPAPLRLGRPGRGHGVGRNGGALSDSRRICARPLPAGIRPARWFGQHRSQRRHRHDYSRCLRMPAMRRLAAAISCSQAAGRLRPVTRSTAPRPCSCSASDAAPHGFTLDREIGNFILTHPDMRVPDETSEFAINASNERFWEPPMQRYVEECKAGKTGPRGRDFNMRWIAAMVAEVQSHPDPPARVHVPARQQGSEKSRAPAPALRSQSNGDC